MVNIDRVPSLEEFNLDTPRNNIVLGLNIFKRRISSLLGPKNKIDSITFYIKNNTIIIDEIDEIKNREYFINNILDIIVFTQSNGLSIESIDFNKIKSPKICEFLNNTIIENYPIISIKRIIPGSIITNIIFKGIKDLNDDDLIGKLLVDELIRKIKTSIISKISNSDRFYTRVIRSDYKNFTFSGNNSVSYDYLFNGVGSKNDFIKEILEEIDFSSYGITSSKDIDYIKNEIIKYFSFGLGESYVSNTANNIIFLYESEISSKKDNSDQIQKNTFCIKKLKNISAEFYNLENRIIDEYKGKQVHIGNAKYDVLITFMGNSFVNPVLLKYVRKNEDIGDKKLVDYIKKYIDLLNNGFDFISPTINTPEDDEKLEIEVNNTFKTGVADIDLLIRNHKGTLTKKYLEKYSKYNLGKKYFIDIIDMGIMNLADFRRIALDLYEGKINQNDTSLLTKSGENITQKLIKLARDIEAFGGKVALGGDEIYIFFDENISDISNKIHLAINKVGLRGRISSGKNTISYDKLDSNSGILKSIERRIEEIIIKLELNIPTNFSIELIGDLSKDNIDKLRYIEDDILLKVLNGEKVEILNNEINIYKKGNFIILDTNTK